MATKLLCPRCKQLLSVPGKMAGNYANCPRCSGRFWVPKDAQSEGSDSSDVVMLTGRAASAAYPAVGAGVTTPSAVSPAATPKEIASALSTAAVAAPPVIAGPSVVAAPPVVAPPRPAVAVAPSSAVPTRASVAPLPPPTPPPALASPRPAQPPASVAATPPAVVPARKVARLITAEAAASTIPLAADGQLPELRLEEIDKKEDADVGSKTVRPMVLAIALSVSVLASVALVWLDLDSASSPGRLDRAKARQQIEEHYFAGMDSREPLQPYQNWLREAQRAHSRGNHKAEHELYRKVLKSLRSERSAFERGLTGSRKRDKDLEDLIAILLNES